MSIRYASKKELERLALEERVEEEIRCPHCRVGYTTPEERDSHSDRCALNPSWLERRTR